MVRDPDPGNKIRLAKRCCNVLFTLKERLTLTFKCPIFAILFCLFTKCFDKRSAKIVSEYDQEIPQSQTADNTVAPRGRAVQTSRDTRKTN